MRKAITYKGVPMYDKPPCDVCKAKNLEPKYAVVWLNPVGKSLLFDPGINLCDKHQNYYNYEIQN